MKEVLWFCMTALLGYLLGSINTGIIVSKVLMHGDVRKHGSGSAGMTNMLRTYGKKAAILTAMGDVLKGALAVWMGQWLFAQMLTMPAHWGGYLAYVFAVIGHWKPVFFGFKGGKCILVSAGGLLVIQPMLVVLLGSIFLLFFLPTRMVSAGSVAMGAAFPFVTGLYGYFVMQLRGTELKLLVVVTAFIGALVLYLHRANIKRIWNGTEYRFEKKKKEADNQE